MNNENLKLKNNRVFKQFLEKRKSQGFGRSSDFFDGGFWLFFVEGAVGGAGTVIGAFLIHA